MQPSHQFAELQREFAIFLCLLLHDEPPLACGESSKDGIVKHGACIQIRILDSEGHHKWQEL